MPHKTIGTIAVLAGGPSNEREISLRSGRAVHAALSREGVEAIFVDMHDDIDAVIRAYPMDVAFLALHGRFGEDGTVQRALEAAGIPYTGSGPEASRRALDKIKSKAIFVRNGIPTPHYLVYQAGTTRLEDLAVLGLPVVVKPHAEGSSIGLGVARTKQELREAIDRALAFDSRLVVEEFIDGRELTVGILEEEPLPTVEIVTRGHLYDYAAKYNDPDTRYLAPAPIDPAISRAAGRIARRAHRAIGCRSFSRVDMMLDRTGGLFVLEVNTIPGMTERSLLPKAAAVAGCDFSALCVRLIRNALTSRQVKGRHGKTKT